MYVPPPLEILHRKYTNKEPVRTGFNQGLIPVKIKYNVEASRSIQGPQIHITTNQQRRKDREVSSSASNRGSSKSGIRSMSRDGSINKNSAAKEPSKTLPKAGEVTVSDFMKGETGEEQEVQEVIRDATTSETSLRHLFYLEYKKNFPEGQKNPIVYSRFGKAHYRSNEKFDVNNFNQLVRTCNLKKFFKSQESNALIKGNNRKFSEPVSFPSGDYYRPQGP